MRTPVIPKLCALLVLAAPLAAQEGTPETRRTTPLSDVRLEGELGARYQAATCNLLTRCERYSLESFAASAAGKPGALWWDWPGDQIGRWLSVLHVAQAYGWTPAVEQRARVKEAAFPLMTAEGHFGVPGTAAGDDARIPSGNAFALAGVMLAFGDTGDRTYLQVSRRLAGYFGAQAPAWEKRAGGRLHEFYGHCLDGLVALHEASGDAMPLELAKRIARFAGRTRHTHHSLSLCRGLIALARVSGEAAPLEAAADYLAWCRENQLVSGGLPESLPSSPQDEGCALADWIVVNLMMFLATGEDRYLEDAEHVLVNHFAMHQFHTGGFGHRGFGREIVGGKNWQGWEGRFGSENPGCCSLWGQWALGQVGGYIATYRGETIEINLYPCASIDVLDRDLRLVVRSDYPRMRRAEIAVHCDRPQRFALALRIPAWAEGIAVELDGAPAALERRGGRAVLTRTWRGGEVLAVRFAGGLHLVPWPASRPEGVSVFDGPLCLGLSSADADVDPTWTVRTDAAGKLLLDPSGSVRLVDPEGRETTALEPIGRDWMRSKVKAPNRLRILFRR